MDTPVLTADFDAVERNVAKMQRYCNEHGLALRPHIKTHKLPEIARMQVEAGARGITCQKLGEAEVMAAAGFDDILISFPLVGPEKVERLRALAERIRVIVVGDSAAVAQGLEGIPVDFLVECDTGGGRTGVQTAEEAARLAELVAGLRGPRFRGLMTYPLPPESGPWLRAAREAIEARGLAVDCVSGGGTPTAYSAHTVGELTELRVGTYVYGDRACIANGSVPLEDCALRVVATVVSTPTPDRAIIDAGSKTLTSDVAIGATGYGLIVEHPEAEIYLLNEEHGMVDVAACARKPQVGDEVTIIPNHACVTANMHDELVVLRGGQPATTLRTAARGKVR